MKPWWRNVWPSFVLLSRPLNLRFSFPFSVAVLVLWPDSLVSTEEVPIRNLKASMEIQSLPEAGVPKGRKIKKVQGVRKNPPVSPHVQKDWDLCTLRHRTCAHYVTVSKIQWKPFCLATQLYPQDDWTGWHVRVNYDVFAQGPTRIWNSGLELQGELQRRKLF